MKTTVDHHFGRIETTDNPNILIIELKQVQSYRENQQTIRKMIDWAIMENFIPSGNYHINVINEPYNHANN